MKDKKGIIFALDGAIAISVVLIMLMNTTYYFTTTSQESLSQSQVIKRGYDVVALFDEAERLDFALRDVLPGMVPGVNFVDDRNSYNTAGSELVASHYLPNGYNMTIELYDAVKTECFNPCTITGTSSNQHIMLEQNDLIEGGDLYVQVSATLDSDTSGNPQLSVVFDGNPYPMTSICDVGETCTYTTKDAVLGFPIGPTNKNIRIYTDNGDEFTIDWIRILDDPAYMLSSEKVPPRGQFIGSGERWYAAFDANGHFEGIHKVGFKVWIEGNANE